VLSRIKKYMEKVLWTGKAKIIQNAPSYLVVDAERKSLLLSLDGWGFDLSILDERKFIETQNWRSVGCYLGLSITSRFAIGFSYDWYDGPLSMFDLGFFHIDFSGFHKCSDTCKKHRE
jgi:hypothetical protein